MAEAFWPNVQYTDCVGKVSADDGHHKEFYHLLIEHGLMTNDETLIGIIVDCSENWIGQVADFSVTCLLVAESELAQAYKGTDPVIARKVVVRLSPLEFLERFKRFAFTLASPHVRLHDAGYVVKEPH